MTDFWQRLRDRKLVQWALAYGAGAFALIQILDIVAQRFAWPEQAMRLVIIALAIGFFVALVLAWYHGERGAQRVSGTELLIVALLLSIGGMIAWRLAPRGTGAESVSVPEGSAHARARHPGNGSDLNAATKVAAAAVDKKSIAVLPFTDLSPTHDQEYFSDGMAEEILDALSHVKDLKVAGRTSAFYYKGRNEDLRTIGRALDVANILEGSVRKQGDKVRITAQLIRSEDGFHMWSESYDGDLKDVFALQEKIARAITDRLQVLLEGEQANRLVPITTRDPHAYSLYLQATSIFDRRDAPHFREAIAALDEAIALDPAYARAHSRMATLYAAIGAYTEVDPAYANAKAIASANAALAIDPRMAEPHAALGLTYGKQLHGLLRQREEFERAIALEPDDVISNFWYGLALVMSGYRDAGIARFDHALAVDPMMPNVVRWRGVMYLHAGDVERAGQFLLRARSLGLVIAERELADIAFLRGDSAAAITKWADGTRTIQAAMPAGSTEAIAAGIFGDAAAKRRALAVIDAHLARTPTISAGQVPLSLVKLGEDKRAIELVERVPASDNSDFFARLWSPAGKPTRALPEFPAFLQSIGLIELWDKYGAPDVCRKLDTGGYDCE